MEETESRSIVDISSQEVTGYFEKIKEFQITVKKLLTIDTDYGSVQKGRKPSLWKSGAEKILNILGARPNIKTVKEEFIPSMEIKGITIPYYDVRIEIQILNKRGEIISEGTGSCNTMEKKYCMSQGSMITDPVNYFGIKNTILKMAEKRALVDATLHISALSDLYTQDVEDMDDSYFEKKEPQPRQTTVVEDPMYKQIKEWINKGKTTASRVTAYVNIKGADKFNELSAENKKEIFETLKTEVGE